ncbi:hypothetical protein SASPL_143160 [Salvia splendens]|uniref:Phospholipase D n=1 Tax=Salvia splendens TaxID=180675 RepID=A0A8X8WN37_SALSN|nr:hypothetical protein SASPL_143160 [Salvia splendens]
MAHLSYSDSMSGSSQHGQGVQFVPFKTSTGSLRVLLLHGNLDIWVKEAKNLPNMDMFHKNLGDMFGRLSGKFLSKVEGTPPVKITSDPYVTISVSNAVIGRTFVISNSENPVWSQHFNLPVAHYGAEVHFVVKDSDVVGSQMIGAVGIPVEQLISGVRIEGTYPILAENGKQCNPGAVLTLSIEYTPMERVPLYHGGVGGDVSYQGVPGTYFPIRRGGRVTLYQDAHADDELLPKLCLANGRYYNHGHCWHDIYDAICQARRLIYITGWSVYHLVQLVRDGPNAKNSVLGEVLKTKSQEGVRVLLLIWDDPTSTSILGYKTLWSRLIGHTFYDIQEGVMNTNDEETRRYFKHSSVQVLLCPRSAGKGSWAKKQGATSGCPREPWHDLHCKIDGPAAYDVLTNFQERWLMASKRHGLQKLKTSYDDSLLKLERIPDVLGIDGAAEQARNDPEGWHVQVFRSIDSNSVEGFPKDPKDAPGKNLVCGKNLLIDMSIHTAYVKAIRAAQHFIYIENQYFLGSSFNWSNYNDLGANNLIPMEIALKIANKIRARERFAVYIIVPMWPEGAPTSTPTQRILFWQYNTMQMMYETIYKALQEVGMENEYEPQDYLNFFCLGNRETDVSGGKPSTKSSSGTTPQALSRKNSRFMIYVHSKGMIVDDEFVLMGSANINQRSLEGTRDTEIAMGAYQPQYIWANKHANPHGEIYGYRMSLWAEHTGTIETCFEQPESLECVRRVRWMGELNWKQFAANEVSDMRGHLLKYPVEVDRTGKVRPLPGNETFPDMGGKIIGTFSGIQENLTI